METCSSTFVGQVTSWRRFRWDAETQRGKARHENTSCDPNVFQIVPSACSLVVKLCIVSRANMIWQYACELPDCLDYMIILILAHRVLLEV